jgi:hypothetical protein
MMVFFVDKFEITHERKRGGTSKEEESHVVALRRNKGRGKKNVDFSSVKVSFFAKSNS